MLPQPSSGGSISASVAAVPDAALVWRYVRFLYPSYDQEGILWP
jgi:hypothetical protein